MKILKLLKQPVCNSKVSRILLSILIILLFLNTRCPKNNDDSPPDEETRIKWKFFVPQPVYYSSPALGEDGTIYFASGIFKQTISGNLYAMDPDGNLKWSYPLDNNGNSPVIGQEGDIYLQDRKNILYAFKPDGSLKWKNIDYAGTFAEEVGQKVPAIGNDGTLYVGVYDSICAINPNDGKLIWEFDAKIGGNGYGSSPVIGLNKTIYIAMNRYFLAVNPNATLKWKFNMHLHGEKSFSSPTIAHQGTIYLATENNDGGYMYALNPDGSLKWRLKTEEKRIIRASPSIGADGTIYVTTKYPPQLLALYPDGTKKWVYDLESVHGFDDIYSSPTIGVDGTIYFGAETGFVYAVKGDGTLAWKQEIEVGINWSSPALKNNGIFYIGTIASENGGNLYAIQSESMGLVNFDCPKFRYDNKNSGRFRN